MRIPVRSETDALYATCGVGALIAASVIVGALIDPLVGVALFVGGVGGALFWELGTEDPYRAQPLREAWTEGPHGATERRRVLVVANRTLAGEELRETLRRAAADGAELHVVAPILPSRVHYIGLRHRPRAPGGSRAPRRRSGPGRARKASSPTGRSATRSPPFGDIEDELREFGPTR